MTADGTSEGMLFREALKSNGELLASLIKWGAILIGGMCLLIYTNEIGRFPAGMGIGEGLAFYLISAGFFFAFMFYWLGMTALGAVVMRWPAEWLLRWDRRRDERKKVKTAMPIATNLSAMTGLEIICVALFGALELALMILSAEVNWLPYILVPVLQGSLIALWLLVNRRHDFEAAGLLLPNAGNVKSNEPGKKQRNKLRGLIPLILIIAPLMLMPEKGRFVDLAFRLAQIRKENVTIHVQAPWHQPFVDAGLKPTQSFLGKGYVAFTCSKVLLDGIGTTVVIEIPSIRKAKVRGSNACVPLSVKKMAVRQVVSIPSDKVWVE